MWYDNKVCIFKMQSLAPAPAKKAPYRVNRFDDETYERVRPSVETKVKLTWDDPSDNRLTKDVPKRGTTAQQRKKIDIKKKKDRDAELLANPELIKKEKIENQRKVEDSDMANAIDLMTSTRI